MSSGELQLNDPQYETLERLVGCPSPYSQVDPISDENRIQEMIQGMIQGHCRCSRQEVSNMSCPQEPRFNIIAEKGAEIQNARFVVMIYVHVDTIKQKPHWKNDYQLRREGEFLKGIGSYDMKSGVMLLVDLLRTVKVPKNITLVGAFCVGEERDSDGISTLMQWPYIKSVNLVLSPEIGSMGNYQHSGQMLESDNPKDVIVGRPGSAKINLLITTGDSHIYNVQAPNAIDLTRSFVNRLIKEFEQRSNGGLRMHGNFGLEDITPRSQKSLEDGEFASVPAGQNTRFEVRIVPPTTVEEIRRWFQEVLETVMMEEHWTQRRIGAQLTTFGMFYEPYIIRTDSPHARFVFDAVKKHYGAVRLSPGQAVSDGSFGHFHLNQHLRDASITQQTITQIPADPCPLTYCPWIEIGPLGQGAHKDTERVYEASLVMLIDFYRSFITKYLPEYVSNL